MNKFICFIHIEKCAGTTMHHILHQNFLNYFALSPDRIDYPDMSEKQLDKFIKSCKVTVRGVGGHMVVPYMDYEKHLEQKIFYFSFLRKPEDRYLSFLNHRINRMKFDWDVDHFVGISQFNNLITRKFAGEDNLQKAIDVIEEKVEFIGFMDKYDEGLVLLKNILAFPKMNLNYERSNVLTSPKVKYTFSELSESQKSAVIENNKLDIELYKYIKDQVYPKYKQAYQGNLEEDLGKHLESNKNHKFSKLRLNIDKAKNFGVRKLIFKKKIFH